MESAPLSVLLRQAAAKANRDERQIHNCMIMVDGFADLHNDLTDWATSTEHAEAAEEVLAILDQYVNKTKPTSGGRHRELTDDERLNSPTLPMKAAG